MKARLAKKILKDFLKGVNIVPASSIVIIKSDRITHEDWSRARLPTNIRLVVLPSDCEVLVKAEEDTR